jgi:hypothetical protein
MIRAYWSGARAAAQRWPLIVVLWLTSAAFGLAFALASGAWLTDALDGSLATRTLFRSLDPEVFVDLWYHHWEGLQVVLTLGVVLLAVHTVLWWWLHGVVIASLQLPDGSRGRAWMQGLELAPAMAALWVIAAIILALFNATRSGPAALIWDEIGIAAAILWVVGYVFLVAVHDHARLRVRRAAQSPPPAYRWAFGFVLRGGERAFPLACALQVSGAVLWLVYQAIGLAVPMTAVLGLTGSLLWGEAFLLACMWVRVWFFAAQNELQT